MQDKTEFSHLTTALGPKIIHSRKSYLYFGGTAYFGNSQNEKFLKLYLAGIERFGLNNGTSRNNNIGLGIYDEVEQYAADKLQCPSSANFI